MPGHHHRARMYILIIALQGLDSADRRRPGSREIRQPHLPKHIFLAAGTFLPDAVVPLAPRHDNPVVEQSEIRLQGSREHGCALHLAFRREPAVVAQKVKAEHRKDPEGGGQAQRQLHFPRKKIPEIEAVDDLHDAVGQDDAAGKAEQGPAVAAADLMEHHAQRQAEGDGKDALDRCFRFRESHSLLRSLRRTPAVQEQVQEEQDRRQRQCDKRPGHRRHSRKIQAE